MNCVAVGKNGLNESGIIWASGVKLLLENASRPWIVTEWVKQKLIGLSGIVELEVGVNNNA